MSRRAVLALLVAAIVCAGIGTALILRGSLIGAPAYGWTAYAPLRSSITSGSARYTPFDPTWLTWAPSIGAALLAIGAGVTGALTAATLTRAAASRTSLRSGDDAR